MSPFAKLMLRFGWIRLSSYGLEVTLDGRLVSARLLPEAQLDLDWSNVPSPSLDLASTFDPALASIPTRTPPPLPPARTPIATTPQTSAPTASVWPLAAPASVAPASVTPASVAPASVAPAAPADDSLSEEEEWAWQAAVARAKAESDSPTMTTQNRSETEDEATGLADTARLPGSATTVDPDPQLADLAAAQVTQADLPANDALPAETVTSVDTLKLRPLLASQTSETASQDDEWTAMRRQIEAKDSEEKARKARAMREIQRLQGRSPLADFRPKRVVAQPQRKRMAAGTSPAPTARPAIPARAAGPTLRPSQSAPAMSASNHDTKIDLPRITERLSR